MTHASTARHIAGDSESHAEGSPLVSLLRRLACSSAPDVLFYLAYGFLTVAFMFTFTFFPVNMQESVDGLAAAMKVAVIVLLAIKLIMRPPSWRGLLLGAALIVVAIVSRIQSVTEWALWIALFVVSADGIDIKNVALISLGVMGVLLVIDVIGTNNGFFIDNVVVRYRDDGTELLRHSFGLHHANTFAACLFTVTTALAVVTFGKNPIPAIAGNVASIIINTLFLDSRTFTAVAVMEIALLLVFYFVHGRKAQRVIGVLLICLVAVVVLGSYWLMANYDPSRPLDELLNRVISLRFSYAHYYLGLKPLSLFGQSYGDVPPVSDANGAPLIFLVDDSYCRMIMENGIIPTGLFLAGSFGLLIHEVRRGRWSPVLFGLSLMLVYASTENYLMQIAWNFCIIAIGSEFLYDKGSVLSNPFLRERAAATFASEETAALGAGSDAEPTPEPAIRGKHVRK